jgi:hypothetical protein
VTGRGQDADRNPDGDGDQGPEGGEDQGGLEALHDGCRDRPAQEDRIPEVPAHQAPQPPGKLQRDGQIQPELPLQLEHVLCRRIGPQDHPGRIPRCEVDEDEGGDGHHEHHGKQPGDSPGDVGNHSALLAMLGDALRPMDSAPETVPSYRDASQTFQKCMRGPGSKPRSSFRRRSMRK